MTVFSKFLRLNIPVLIGCLPLAAVAAPPATSAYVTDPQSSHVQDETSKEIGQVNVITCYISSMRPDALVNQGPYNALVDKNFCEAQGGGGSSSNPSTDYQAAVVDSTRATNMDPMRAKVWIDQNQNGQADRIYANLSATEGPSAANPYGVFRLDFCGKLLSGAAGCMESGYLEGSSGGVSYYDIGQGGGGSSTTALQLTANGTTSGSGEMLISMNAQTSQFAFAYDASLFRRTDGTTDLCFSRDASDPATGLSVWRYGLYDATSGAQVTRNSGFPLNFSSGGTVYQAFISYWGLSAPSDVLALMSNGSAVQKIDYSSSGSTATDYTLVRAAGKLTKHTRQATTLLAFDKIRFNTWIGDATSFYSGAASFTGYELYWDQANGVFKVTGQMTCGGSNGCVTVSLPVEQSVDASFWVAQGGISGSSQSFGGEVFINLQGVSGAVNAASVPVVYRSEDIVYPADMPATLYCINDCPTAASLASYFAPGSVDASPFGATFNNSNLTPAGSVVTYTADTAAVALVDGNAQDVFFSDAAAMANSPQYQNGVTSGHLIANLADAECAPATGMYCDNKAADLPVYYVWQTGANAWDQFAAVKDAMGAFVKFDAPLQVSFSVPAGAAYGPYAGTTMMLQYGGFGQLWGIPGTCVSPVDNSQVTCDTPNSRYVPAFVIPFDAAAGVVHDGQTPYLVKWLDREIRFANKDIATCAAAGLNVPTGTVLPTASVLQDTTDPASGVYIGDRPTVTADPRVIQGEVKY